MTIFYIFIAILVLLFMITVHELGHYLAGKLLKFKINEFSIGFGKALYKKTKKNGEIFSIRLIPLGGYCAFDGEDEEKDKDNPQAFNNQKGWKRLIVLFAGAFFNLVVSILIIICIFTFSGVNLNTVDSFAAPADEATAAIAQPLEKGDAILKLNGKYLFFESLSTLTEKYKVGDNFTLTIYRPSTKQFLDVTVSKGVFLDSKTNEEYNGIGIIRGGDTFKFGFFRAFSMSFVFAYEFAALLLGVLFKLLTFRYSLMALGGPVTTVAATAEVARAGALSLLSLTGILGLNLAIFNLLPFPALDGARMVFVLIEMIRKKPINRNLEAKIHTFGIIFLFSLVILVDVIRIVTGNLLNF